MKLKREGFNISRSKGKRWMINIRKKRKYIKEGLS